jgi:hypothetical protein
MSAPAEPTLSIVNDGTGTSATATVAGDAGVTHRLYYRKATGQAAWTAGLTRTGNGTIQQTGLVSGTRYGFLVVSSNVDGNSLPSRCVFLEVCGATAVRELAALEVKALLDELVVETHLTAAQRPAHYVLPTSPKHLEAHLYMLDPVDSAENNIGETWWWQPFAIEVYVLRAESAATPVDPVVLEAEARVLAKLMADQRLNKRAVRSEVAPSQYFKHGAQYEGVRVNFRALVATPDTDPFTNAAGG